MVNISSSIYGLGKFPLKLNEWISVNIPFSQVDKIFILLLMKISTHRYQLVGMIHHGNQQIKQDDNVDDRVGAEH